MRVLHWHPSLLGGGGVAIALLGLAEAQADLGAEVAVAAAEPAGEPLYEPMIPHGKLQLIQWAPTWRFHRPGVTMRGIPQEAARRLRAFQPDVVHIHGELNLDNLWVPRLFACPLVLSAHGGFHPEIFHKGRRGLKRIYFRIAKALLYRHVLHHALCPSERDHIAQALPEAPCYCIPEGPNMQTQREIPSFAWPRSNDACSFLFVGRLDVYTKGLDILLEAFAEVRRRAANRAVTLTLVGPDRRDSLTWLQQRTYELGITDSVTFTGSISGLEVSRYLHEADVYVQLSRHDAFPLSLVEALLAGKPAIVSSQIGTMSYPEMAALPHVRIVPPATEGAAEAMTAFATQVADLYEQAHPHQAAIHAFFCWQRVARLHLSQYEELTCQGEYLVAADQW